MPGARPRDPKPGPMARLDFLDGLRGLAALYVVLHHASLEVPGGSLSRGAALAHGLLRHGHFAVAVFIVLSGYCLMRPVARDPSNALRGGTLGYLGRRARRILPPYYAALALCWLLIAVVPGLQAQGHVHVRWDRALPAFEPGVVVSHLLLFHNLDERWMFRVDPPLWSVATEWQIYLLFPPLLALWRRHGIAATVAAGYAAGYAVAALSGWLGNPALAKLCPWYAGLFALGMAGAVRGVPGSGSRPVSRRSWLLAAVLVASALLLAVLAAATGADGTVLVADGLVGAASTWLIVRLARRKARGVATRGRGILRLLESRTAVALGSFSYSLYLIHFPLLAWSAGVLRARDCGSEGRFWVLLLVATPTCGVAAFLFSVVFERRALSRIGGFRRVRSGSLQAARSEATVPFGESTCTPGAVASLGPRPGSFAAASRLTVGVYSPYNPAK